jgi:phosphatidylserine/phosphatidylglycerophosphate/cardiolipin synthase-like enzyme
MLTEPGTALSAAINEFASEPMGKEGVDWLIDNADAYRAVLAAIGRAESSIWITQLAFDADCVAYDADDSGGRSESVGRSLLHALIEASTTKGVAVRILLNETLLLDTARTLRASLRRASSADVQVRGIRRFPQLLHAKMLVIDEREAFLFGSPFVNGYWDDSDHLPRDPRRPNRELGGRPLHDVSVRLTGPIVHDLGTTFAELWNDVSVGAPTNPPVACRHDPAAPLTRSARIVRTVPSRVLDSEPTGVTEILTEVEETLSSARRTIYIEHQYLSSRRVASALKTALAREPALEVIVVLNANPDVTAYRGWQRRRLVEAGLLRHPRVGVFSLWRAAPSADAATWTINQLFIHSKVLIVDDERLTMGSANLDGVSLHCYGDDFSSWLGRRVFRGVRNFDVNIAMECARDSTENVVAALRVQLWAEHLALPSSDLAVRPREGWLPLWRDRAAACARLLSTSPSEHGGSDAYSIVTPYSTSPTPGAQLRNAGVRAVNQLDIRFDPSWVEVCFSANWVRNMFA